MSNKSMDDWLLTKRALAKDRERSCLFSCLPFLSQRNIFYCLTFFFILKRTYTRNVAEDLRCCYCISMN